MLVSLFTDASVNHQKQSGGWGAWARSERGKVWDGGMITHHLTSSNEAEAIAVLRGAALAHHVGILMPGDTVIVQLDNQHVCRSLNWSWEKGSPMMPQIRPDYSRTEHEISTLDAITEFELRHNIQIASRWIKGHTNGETPRTYVNNACDSLANKGRKMAEKYFAHPKGQHRMFVHNREKVERAERKAEIINWGAVR